MDVTLAPATRPWRARTALGLLALLLIGLAGCGDGDPAGDVGGGGTTTEETSTASVATDPGDVSGAWIDPRDDTHLLLQVTPCVQDPVATAVETEDTVEVSVEATATEPPCEQQPVDLRLDAPLGGRRVVDAEHDMVLDVVPADFLYPEPGSLVAADCTGDAAAAAVEHDVDGGLRSDLLACDGNWMAVDTSTNACPATGEAPDDGCTANQHVVYFRNDDGHWTVAFFDDCDMGREQFPDFPDDVCQG